MAQAINTIDVSDTALYTEDRWSEPFARLRRDMPVSYCPESPYGPYWSVTSLDAIQEVEGAPDVFSSDYRLGGITILDALGDREFPNFIAMDRPRHTEQRKVVQPAFNPSEMARREIEIRKRTKELFDTLPVGDTFDWVEEVAVKLTIGMLTILLDIPWDERHNLKRWSDYASDVAPDHDEAWDAEFQVQMGQMLAYFDEILAERRALPPTDDLMSRMVHSDAMGHLDPLERIANIALLIVAGNDTTRNSMSGFVLACNQFPDTLDKLRAKPDLVANATQEIIRWQSPVTHMRRTCVADAEVRGQKIAKGDKVVIWYISGNRDESIFADADVFDISRDNARRHVGFGFGVHRCVGARLAEVQLTVLIEEILSRNIRIEQVGTVERLASPFLHGFVHMPVRIVPNG
jgi:cytochrome P450